MLINYYFLKTEIFTFLITYNFIFLYWEKAKIYELWCCSFHNITSKKITSLINNKRIKGLQEILRSSRFTRARRYWAGEKSWDIIYHYVDTQERVQNCNLICVDSLINRTNYEMKNGVYRQRIHVYMHVTLYIWNITLQCQRASMRRDSWMRGRNAENHSLLKPQHKYI